jgi:hypothetical protein
MVEAARSGSLSRRDEQVKQRWSEFVEPVHAVVLGEGDEQAQRCFFGSILPSEGPFVGQEVVGGDAEVVVHPSTSSPSPRATSRRASTATLA